MPCSKVVYPGDWGISWFELVVSFYHFTGYRFPIRASGAGISYDPDEAAALQSICLRNMIQNLSTLVQQPIFFLFWNLQMQIADKDVKGVIAGIPSRPRLLPISRSCM